MTHTTNFNLSQWAKTDRIRMADFNADNAKLDAALAARNCSVYTASYTGTGELTFTIDFPRKPVAVFISRNDGATFCSGFYGGTCVIGFNVMYGYMGEAAWTENSLTVTCAEPDLVVLGNFSGVSYTVLALLEPDN